MTPRQIALALTALLAVLFAISLSVVHFASTAGAKPQLVAPTTGTPVCGTPQLEGSTTAPAGATTVPAGLDTGSYDTPDTTYWFAPGTHTLGTGEYAQIIPGDRDTYVGGYSSTLGEAVLSGQQLNDYAFTGDATDVTIEYLTVTDFGVYTSDTSDGNAGVVNTSSAAGWTIEDDTMTENGGAGAYLGTNNVVEHNCFSRNGQQGFGTYDANGGSPVVDGAENITVSDNEFVDNDEGGYDEKTGCGCGVTAGKFWATDGFTFEDNYVHLSNPASATFTGDPCVWADTDNSGGVIEGNYLTGCDAEGIVYEAGYFNTIADNTIVDSGWLFGNNPDVAGFPLGAIYISESGYDSRAPSETGGAATITGNVMTNDWGGVVLWENSNRFCGDGSDGVCTLVDSAATKSTCPTSSTKASSVTMYWDCRWRTQDVDVTDNTFSLTASDIGSDCTQANDCGFNGIFSEYATYTPYKVGPSPDECDNQRTLGSCSTAIPDNGFAIPVSLATDQNDAFSDNTYCGPWSFMTISQGDVATFNQWQAGYTDKNGADVTSTPQDAGSTLNGSTCSGNGTTTTTSDPTTTTSDPTTTTSTTSPPPPYTGPVFERAVSAVGVTRITTPAFSISAQGLLLAEVSGRGPTGSGAKGQTFKVTGAGLTWTEVQHTYSGNEYTETFDAQSPEALSGVSVNVTASAKGYDLRLQVSTANQ